MEQTFTVNYFMTSKQYNAFVAVYAGMYVVGIAGGGGEIRNSR